MRAELGPTAGLLVTRADWERVGGIPAGWLGDTSFSWALAEAGVPIHLAGEAVFEHDHGTTLGALLRERFERGGLSRRSGAHGRRRVRNAGWTSRRP